MAGMTEKEYVELKGGICCFKDMIPLRIDVFVFEKTMREVRAAERKKL